MAINAAYTKTVLDGLLKDTYGDKLEQLRPDFGILSEKIPFRSANKVGKDFVQA